MEIRYETLVEDPQSVLRNVCELIGVDYAPQMLTYHRQNLTLFQNPPAAGGGETSCLP